MNTIPPAAIYGFLGECFVKFQICIYIARMEKIQLSTIAISSEAHKLIKVHAAQTNMLIRDVVEQAVREYIEGQKKAKHE
jgi:hypothetical protein